MKRDLPKVSALELRQKSQTPPCTRPFWGPRFASGETGSKVFLRDPGLRPGSFLSPWFQSNPSQDRPLLLLNLPTTIARTVAMVVEFR